VIQRQRGSDSRDIRLRTRSRECTLLPSWVCSAELPTGARPFGSLYALLAADDDPHSTLVKRLRLNTPQDWTTVVRADQLRDLYPLPSDQSWTVLAEQSGEDGKNLLAWSARDVESRDVDGHTISLR